MDLQAQIILGVFLLTSAGLLGEFAKGTCETFTIQCVGIIGKLLVLRVLFTIAGLMDSVLIK